MITFRLAAKAPLDLVGDGLLANCLYFLVDLNCNSTKILCAHQVNPTSLDDQLG